MSSATCILQRAQNINSAGGYLNFDRKGEGRGVFRRADADGGVEGKWRAAAVGGRDVIVGPVGWLFASSWLLQRSGGSQAGWRIFGRTKSECSQQRKSHDQREEEEVLLSHLFPPFGHNPMRIFPPLLSNGTSPEWIKERQYVKPPGLDLIAF